MTEKIENSFRGLLHCLEDFIRSETVVGRPLTIGQTTIIPVFRVSLGVGAGSGGSGSSRSSKGKEKENVAPAGGAGAGAAIVPCAVISVTNGETTVFPLSRNSLQTITDMLPEILAKSK